MRKALVKTSRASPQIARVDDANEIMTYYEKNILSKFVFKKLGAVQ
jgi:hypothetical protein